MADLTAIQEHVRSARVYFRQETDIDMVPLHFVLSCLLKYNRDVANSLVATSVDDPTTALCEGLANLTDGRQVCNKINTTDRFLTVYRDFIIIKMSDQFGYKTDRDVDSYMNTNKHYLGTLCEFVDARVALLEHQNTMLLEQNTRLESMMRDYHSKLEYRLECALNVWLNSSIGSRMDRLEADVERIRACLTEPCVVCQDRQPTLVQWFDCTHCCVCRTCNDNMSDKPCPLCRAARRDAI